MRVSLHGLAQTASSVLVPLSSIVSGDFTACENSGGVMDTQGNCLPNPAIINPAQQTCISSGGAWDAALKVCSSTLPEGYNPATGTVSPSNTTGTTQTVPQSTVDQNAAMEAGCLQAGGSWSDVTGCTPPSPATNTTLYIVAAIAGLALLMTLLKR